MTTLILLTIVMAVKALLRGKETKGAFLLAPAFIIGGVGE